MLVFRPLTLQGFASPSASFTFSSPKFLSSQAYSAGLSETILGKAIKQHNLPRHEIVVMTKVCSGEVT